MPIPNNEQEETMTRTNLQIETTWERPALTAQNGFATLMIRIVAPAASTRTTRAPIDLAFVIDRSGSMSGRPIELAKQAVSHAAGMLDQRDRAALVVFDDHIDLLHRLAEVSARQRNELRMALARVDARGSTNLCDGWLTGCRELARHETPGDQGRVRRAILLTDGLANQGEMSPSAICQHATELRRRGITTTTLGMGQNFDEGLLPAMAEAGGGNFSYIESASQLARTFERELDRLTAVTAAQLNLRLRLPDGLHGHLLSPFPVERIDRRFDVAIDDLSANDEVILIFEITGRDLLRDSRLPLELSVRWTEPATNHRQTEEIPIAPLTVVDDRIYAEMPRTDEVAGQAAMLKASAGQRRAMELDRSGNFAESRQLLHEAFDVLMAAPETDDVLRLRTEARTYADQDSSAPLTEHTRKQAVHNALSRSRRRQPIDPAS
jgi:Ca-activated chloride channel family protein